MPTTPPRDDERREAAAQRIEDYVSTILAAAPELTDEQKDRLVAIIRGGT